jgi:MoxR-like ATPase
MSVETDCRATIQRLKSAVGSVLLGKPAVIEGALVALLGDGHILIEDVPGVGKTLLARAVAQSIEGVFHRIQFTPDLLPSDIVGSSVYDSSSGDFSFKPGPLFANVLLADEINRTSPRTQSALLEAMNDRQVSVDGTTYTLKPPFLVVATQNPFEFEGTYQLPESQLDRFMLRLKIGYPPRSEELRLLAEHRAGNPVDALEPVVHASEVLQLQELVRQTTVEDAVAEYLLEIVHATRVHPDLRVGVSTRGALLLYRAGQALAFLRGRDFVVPDDVKELVEPVLAHRIVGKTFSQGDPNDRASGLLAEIVERIPVPE